LYQFDVKGAFPLAECKERVYINLPGKYRLPKGKVLQCRRLIHSLKQTAHGWNQMLVKWLLDYGFINVDNNGVTFVNNVTKDDGSLSKILLSIYVDDGLVACSDEAMYKEFNDVLKGSRWVIACLSTLHVRQICTWLLRTARRWIREILKSPGPQLSAAHWSMHVSDLLDTWGL